MSEVDEIKQRIDIVDLVSQFVALKRTGRTYIAVCPFHTERTPSFHVDPTRQSWHCFGACGTVHTQQTNDLPDPLAGWSIG